MIALKDLRIDKYNTESFSLMKKVQALTSAALISHINGKTLTVNSIEIESDEYCANFSKLLKKCNLSWKFAVIVEVSLGKKISPQ